MVITEKKNDYAFNIEGLTFGQMFAIYHALKANTTTVGSEVLTQIESALNDAGLINLKHSGHNAYDRENKTF